MGTPSFAPSGFFVLRTPLLPFEHLARLGDGVGGSGGPPADARGAIDSDRVLVHERMRALVAEPAIREALLVASPSLDAALDVWLAEPGAPRAEDVPATLMRYLARMAGRPTPFGLFSGNSTGVLAAGTRLVVAPRGEHRRRTRLDMQYLTLLCDALGRDAEVRAAVRYRPSSGMYSAAGQRRHLEARDDLRSRVRAYDSVAVEPSEHLDAVLARAAEGARPAELVECLLEMDPAIDPAGAQAFVQSVIESQLLVSDLSPLVTGGDPLRDIVATLRGASAGVVAADTLAAAGEALAALDETGVGHGRERYEAITASLRVLPVVPDPARLYQVDLYKPAPDAAIGREPLAELVRAAHLLAEITPEVDDPSLARFREAFIERYGERLGGGVDEASMVPLGEALDEDSGIGFPHPDAGDDDPSPLLAGLKPWQPGTPEAPPSPTGPRDRHMLRRLCDALRSGASEWILSDADVAALRSEVPAQLSDAFAVNATLRAASTDALDRGELLVLVDSVTGPSGVTLLGRFCHDDPELRRRVEAHLRAEEALRPAAIFAEVVHMPEPRLGNVLCRPALRAHEIPFLGRSGVPQDRQIGIDDLLVTVADGRVVLWSRRHRREVVPRLTTAHNFSRESLGIYRFLCALQRGSNGMLSWSWGRLAGAPFLPRVSRGRLVLALARWSLGQEDVAPLREARGVARWRVAQELRERLRLPRWVGLAGSVLPVDLHNIVALDAFAHSVKGMDRVVLTELFADAEGLVASSSEGRFAHEIVVPFVRTQTSTAPLSTPVSTPRSSAPVCRTFPPGSEWLYAKLYAGAGLLDTLLIEAVAPLIEAARSARSVDGWFFIRYVDPRCHLRLRLRGDPARLTGSVLPLLHEAVAPLIADGRVWRVQLDTYEREVQRYGGPEGMACAEDLFEADSDCVVAILAGLDAEGQGDAAWRAALVGCHRLLVDFRLDLDAQVRVLREAGASFGAGRRPGAEAEAQLSRRYRQERGALEALVAARPGGGHPLDAALCAFEERSRRIAPVAARLLDLQGAGRLTVPIETLATSYLHMHTNRMLSATRRSQELVLYDWLARTCRSQAARR